MALPVTALYAALLGLLHAALALLVVRGRARSGVSLGAGEERASTGRSGRMRISPSTCHWS